MKPLVGDGQLAFSWMDVRVRFTPVLNFRVPVRSERYDRRTTQLATQPASPSGFIVMVQAQISQIVILVIVRVAIEVVKLVTFGIADAASEIRSEHHARDNGIGHLGSSLRHDIYASWVFTGVQASADSGHPRARISWGAGCRHA